MTQTEFYTSEEKGFIMKELRQANPSAIECVINEIQRLESIIKSYEMAFDAADNIVNRKTYKSPAPITLP